MQNKIDDLRNHLFATLEALRDKEAPMDIERAKAISNIANSIIESAKVEVKYLDLIGGKGSGFIGEVAPTGQLRLAGKGT
jgi:hypothetical protein